MEKAKHQELTVDRKTGLLYPARLCPSSNQDERPAEESPGLIVIHSISLPPGQFGGTAIEELFLNCLDCSAHPYFRQLEDLQVSSHLLIRRDGEVVQFVPFSSRAWHAGESVFRGRHRCNDFSIGIELEGDDDTPYTDQQYSQLGYAVGAIMQAYPAISAREIAGHCDIAPGRKTDPGPAFDWLRLYDGLNSGGP